jgi:hypothetical protein
LLAALPTSTLKRFTRAWDWTGYERIIREGALNIGRETGPGKNLISLDQQPSGGPKGGALWHVPRTQTKIFRRAMKKNLIWRIGGRRHLHH